MKGGVSALVVAAEAIARTCSQSGTRLEGDLVVAVTADEERNCLGADELVKERELFEGLGAALVAEPTSLGLYIAEKGAFWVELEFFGKTAHGSMPRMGANAIGAAAEFLVRWEQEYRTDEPVHPLLGTPTLNVGMINGGVKVNVVADHCAVQLDMRTVPGLEHSDLRRRLERLAAAVCASRAGTSARLNIVSDRASVSCPEDSELAVALGATLQDLTAKAPQFGGVPYCTEACIWVPHLQVPAVICGPGSAGMAHQPDEYVETSELELAARAYAATAAQLLAGY
jgi:succinyl-diaminopimelate desuccinylase